MKKKLFYFVLMLFPFCATAQTHPILVTQTELSELAASSDWTSIQSFCDDNLNTVIDHGWAGWDLRYAIEKYSKAYQILKTSNPTKAAKYGKKTVALMKSAARDHNMGGPEDTYGYSIGARAIGMADGSKTVFTLPFAQLAGSTAQAFVCNTEQVAYTYNSNKVSLDRFEPILKISNANGGANNYAGSDYKLAFRDGLDVYILIWTGNNHPVNGTQYYVTYYKSGGDVVQPATNYTISGTSITFKTAPAAGKSIFVKMIGPDYEQTGNQLGGVNAVQPDGPGYQMRTYNPALAFGFDLIFDCPDFTTALKDEFVKILNDQIDWYTQYGYENDGDLGNYFIRGFYTGTMFTAYGTDGVNAKAASLKTQSKTYTDRIFNKLVAKLPGGYGPQGQYANGTTEDVLQVFTIYKNLTGDDLLSKLEWTNNVVTATIHGTKPDRKTFYDGGDWTDLPAVPLVDAVKSFLQYLPNHANAPFARQFLKDVGETAPAGTMTDYKTSFPLAYYGKVSGPVYTRSSWNTDAVWASFSAGEIFMDHQHLDAGHFTIQKGADYLLIDAGEYGDFKTDTFHNTILIDDRGAGNLSTYPPGQGDWGYDKQKITRFENSTYYTYSQADIGSAYANNYDGHPNSVKLALRSFLFIRPQMVIIHDKVKTTNVNVKKIFNCNFATAPTISNGIYTMSKGNSKLFFKPLGPSGVAPVIASIHGKNTNFRNCRITVSGQSSNSFLNVFETVPSTTGSMTPVNYIDATNMEGLEIAGQDTWVALFAKTDSVIDVDLLSYSFTKTGAHSHIVADLNKNYEYEVTVQTGASRPLDKQKFTSSAQGVLFFTFSATQAGTVSIAKLGVAPLAINKGLDQSGSSAYVAHGQILVHWFSQAPTPLNCKIYTTNGKLVGEFNQLMGTGSNDFTHDLSSFQDGVYIIRIRDNYKAYSGKIIK